mmetsp:Transcript_27793/g.89417  ORF Transcript_27793/g.89417 Transcript_27793/m.89417 type:complete len:105 (-) Transcript_27793:52-366(-)
MHLILQTMCEQPAPRRAYHNFDPNTNYPALLMTTSTKDDRVHPYHARCFVKRMQDMGKGDKVFYYENIEGGHGGAADAKQSAYVFSLYMDFLWKVLGPDDDLRK